MKYIAKEVVLWTCSIMCEHMVITKHYLWIKKVIQVQISRNIIMEIKSSTKSIRVVMLHDKVAFIVVRDKT